MNKLECSSHKNTLCKVWFNSSHWFWRRRSFKFRWCIFVIISPWKRAWASFEQIWILFTQGCFVPSLVVIGPLVLEKKMTIWKVYDNDDDDGQRTICVQKSSPEELKRNSGAQQVGIKTFQMSIRYLWLEVHLNVVVQKVIK